MKRSKIDEPLIFLSNMIVDSVRNDFFAHVDAHTLLLSLRISGPDPHLSSSPIQASGWNRRQMVLYILLFVLIASISCVEP